MRRRPPVSIWSPEPDLLARMVEAAGWSVATGGGAGDLPSIALVDARTDAAGAIAALAATDAAVRVALVSAIDAAAQDRLIDAGATQIAVLADDGAGLAPALRLAERALPGRTDRRAAPAGTPALEGWVAARIADRAAVAVIHIAIVRLDLVNAAHGRAAGTALVAAAERRIAAQVAALATDDGDDDDGATQIVRVAGPGFAVAMTGPAERAVLAAARIEEALGRPFRLDGSAAVLGTRIGLAGARRDEDAATLLARAAPTLPEAGEGDDALAVDVHHALAGDQIAILFQPQAALAGGPPTGVEALARWRHPTRGPLGAEALLSAAERAGIGAALSDHISERVLAEAAAWPASLARLRVALNLTAGDLLRPGLVETLLARIDASGFPRARLTLEVTETELMTDLDVGAAVLTALQAAGCRTAIDDFGTGYSSLAYLASLPIDYLKLDRALVGEITGATRGQVVVRAAIDMARSLGIAVIAEGVETAEQRAELAQAGCAFYQGFLLAPPLSADDLAVMMTA